MNFCACNSSTVTSSSGTAAAAASSSFGGYWNRLQILVVMVWKPAGSARAAAEDRGSVLQLARHGVERVRHQHEHERKRVAGDHEDDAGHRIDVEQEGV